MRCPCNVCSWYVNDPPPHDVAVDTQGGGAPRFFDNESVPILVLLAPGPMLSPEKITKIESYLENRIRGRENFHRSMVIEPAGSPGITYERRTA